MPSPVEIVAVVFSFASVWLTVRKNVLCWPVGLIGVVAYFLLFMDLRLYADMGLQVVFFAQGLYGWWFWRRGGEGRREPPVTSLGPRRLVIVGAILVVASLGAGELLSRTDAAAPHLDAFLALTSLTANALLARKILESWWLWITADVLYVGLFLWKGVPMSATLYVVFLLLAVRGALRWRFDEATAALAVTRAA